MSLIKKGILLGIGLLSTAEEKVEEFSKEMIKKGQESQEEAKKKMDSLVNVGLQKKGEIQKTAGDRIKKRMSDFGLVTREDLEKIEARLAAIEEKIGLPPQNRESGGN